MAPLPQPGDQLPVLGRLRAGRGTADRRNHVTKGGTRMTISDSTVAIIGIGNIGGRLAANFAAGGQDFLLAGRDQDAAAKIASDLGGHAEVVSIDEAVDRAGVLVVCLWMDAFEQVIAQYG